MLDPLETIRRPSRLSVQSSSWRDMFVDEDEDGVGPDAQQLADRTASGTGWSVPTRKQWSQVDDSEPVPLPSPSRSSTIISESSRKERVKISSRDLPDSPGEFSVIHCNASELLEAEFVDRKFVLGLPRHKIYDLYHTILSLPTAAFYLFVVASYLSVVSFFAVAYFSTEPIVCLSGAESLWDAWAFSVQTIATIGYGQMAPVCRSADVLVFLESITGILFMSVLTGIIFSRFTKTPPRIMFSDKVVVTDTNELQFRIGNARGNEIYNASITLSYSHVDVDEFGVVFVANDELPLISNTKACMRHVWQAAHIVDDASAFATVAPDVIHKIRNGGHEGFLGGRLTVIFSGVDVTSMDNITAKHVYDVCRDVEFGFHLQPMFVRVDGRVTIDFNKFHGIEVPEPTSSSRPAPVPLPSGKMPGPTSRGPRALSRLVGKGVMRVYPHFKKGSRPRKVSTQLPTPLPAEPSAVSVSTPVTPECVDEARDVTTLTIDSFYETVANSDVKWLIAAVTRWSSVCRLLAPVWQRAAVDLGNRAKFGVVYCTSARDELMKAFDITEFPSVIVIPQGFREGMFAATHSGTAACMAYIQQEYETHLLTIPESFELAAKAMADKQASSLSLAEVLQSGATVLESCIPPQPVPRALSHALVGTHVGSLFSGLTWVHCHGDACEMGDGLRGHASPVIDVLANRIVLMIGVSSPFGVVSDVHVDSFVRSFPEFKPYGVQSIVAVAVASPAVLSQWKLAKCPSEIVHVYSDSVGAVVTSLGCLQSSVDVGRHCARFASIVHNGVVLAFGQHSDSDISSDDTSPVAMLDVLKRLPH